MMVQLNTAQAETVSSQETEEVAAPKDSEVVATLSFAPISDLKFKRYGDGAVLIGQGNELVYLELPQYELLRQFMNIPVSKSRS